MGDLSSFDYKKPFGQQLDFRTSSYRAHYKINPPIVPKTYRPPTNVCSILGAKNDDPTALQSEVKESYVLKAPDPDRLNNPKVDKTLFLKAFDETRVRYPPKPLTSTSTYRNQYTSKWIADEERPAPPFIPSAVATNEKVPIDRIKPNYAKLLDPSATTNNLSYPLYDYNDLGVGSKDNITFWNWNKREYVVWPEKTHLCDKFKSSECPTRRNEFPNQLKPVPHGGMASEMKSNYLLRRDAPLCDFSGVRNKPMSFPDMQRKLGTENMIYGSGVPNRKFVRI